MCRPVILNLTAGDCNSQNYRPVHVSEDGRGDMRRLMRNLNLQILFSTENLLFAFSADIYKWFCLNCELLHETYPFPESAGACENLSPHAGKQSWANLRLTLKSSAWFEDSRETMLADQLINNIPFFAAPVVESDR